MEKKSKKSIVIGITSLVLVTLLLLGLTYAYYRTRIVGNPNNESINVVSKDLSVKYTDGKATLSTEGAIEPGFTATKEFTVENTGSETVSYSVVIDNVVNEYARTSDWTFTLKKGSEVVKSGILPSSKSIILNSAAIASGATDTYTLEIAYANLTDVDQSVDMGKQLVFRTTIEEEQGIILANAKEGTLLAAIGNDNIISEPLTVPGKASSLYNYKSLIDSLIVSSSTKDYYWVYGTGYEYDEKTGTFSLTGVVETPVQYSTSYSQLEGKYLVSNNSYYNSKNTVESAKTIKTTNLSAVYQVANADADSYDYYTIDKSNMSQKVEAVLAQTEDDYGTSYYYRGSVENNYVNYSGMCWRIVRVLGNGAIKLTLADRDNECNSANYSVDNTSSGLIDSPDRLFVWNPDTWTNIVKYENSDIPSTLDKWANGGDYTYYLNDGMDRGEANSSTFEAHLDSTDTNLVATDWCNDTSISKYEDGEYPHIYFGFNNGRTSPSLKCDFTGINDSTATKYNNYLGILSADEVAYAGATKGSFSGNFLGLNVSGGNYWLMTPSADNSGDFPTEIYGFSGTGRIVAFYPGTSLLYDIVSIRPAITLKADTPISSGNGTQTNPYVIN